VAEQKTEQATEEEVAAALAAMFLAPGAPPAGAAASALLLLVPAFVPRELAQRVAHDAASFLPNVMPAPRGGVAERAAYRDNLLYRAFYAMSVQKRLAEAVRGLGVEEAEQALAKALKAEERFFEQHREAARRRVAGARMVDAAAELHGPILGWKHGDPKEPRPSHAAADGKSFRADTVPASTGALPGVLPGCTCTVVAPRPGAEMLR
jgi:hypothetical protein